MEDMASKISELLSDPNGMEKIKTLASALFSDGPEAASAPPNDNSSNAFSLPEGFDIGKIMGLMSAFNSKQSDRRSDLLLALKPHLSSERQERVDKAVRLLKIAALLPVLKEQGVLDSLF